MRGPRGCAIAVALVVSALVLAVSFFFSVRTSPYRYSQAELLGFESFPYDDWAAVLAKFVDDRGRVDYSRLLAEHDELDRFVALVAAVGPRSRPDLFRTEPEQLAYYLNTYNALAIFNVLAHWPMESPHDRSLRFFYGTRFIVDGRKANLFELEHFQILRDFNEPRVHFVLNGASRGDPPLARTPLLPETLEDQLQAATVAFLSDPRNVQLLGDKLQLAELFERFAEDFSPDPVSWIHARRPDLQLSPTTSLGFRPRDRSLNGFSGEQIEQ